MTATSVLAGLAKDTTLQELVSTISADGTSIAAGAALFETDVLVAPLLAGDYWLGGPFDLTGVEHGVNAGYVAFVASLVTDVAGSYLNIDVSQDALTWARAAVVEVAPIVTTTLGGSSTLTAGATSIPIASPVGFMPGDTIVLDSLSSAETLTIAPGGVGASSLTTTTATTKNHAVGVNIDGLYLATAEYQTRGFRYARCSGVNGAVNATVTSVSAQAKASA